MQLYRPLIIIVALIRGISAAKGQAVHDKTGDSLDEIYYRVTPINNNYVVDQGVYSSLHSKEGKPLTAFKYYRIQAGLNGNFLAKPERYGNYLLLDKNGKVIRTVNAGDETTYEDNYASPKETQYDKAGKFSHSSSEKFTAAMRDDTAFVYNSKGKLLFTKQVNDCAVIETDFIAVKKYGLWAMADSTGRNITGYKYNQLQAYPQNSSDYIDIGGGLADRNGKEIIPRGNQTIRQLNGGYFYLYKNGTTEILNTANGERIKGKYMELTGKRFVTIREGYGRDDDANEKIFDLDNRKYIDYKVVKSLPNEAYMVQNKKTKKYSIIKGNKTIKTPAFNEIDDKNEDDRSPYFTIGYWEYAGPEKYYSFDGEREAERPSTRKICGLIDPDMNWVLPMKYREIKEINQTLFLVHDENDSIYIVKKGGEIVAPIHYRYSSYKGKGYYTIQTSDTGAAIIDSTGHVLYNGKGNPSLLCLTDNQGEQVYSTPQLLSYDNEDGNTGIYSMDGKQLQPPLYHIVTSKTSGVIGLKRNDSLYFINYNGKMLFKGRGFEGRRCKMLEGYIAIVQNTMGLWGVISPAGDTILPFIYDTVATIFTNKLDGYALGKNKKYTFVDNSGRIVYTSQNFLPVYMNDSIVSADNKHYYKLDSGTITELGTTMSENVPGPYRRFASPFTNLSSTTDSLPPGIYNRQGKRIAYYTSGYYGKEVASGKLITDSPGAHIALIDTDGAFMVPYFQTPTLLITYKQAIAALYKYQSDVLYHLVNGKMRKDEIVIDSNDKKALLRDKSGSDRGFRFSAPGLKHGLITYSGYVLWDSAVDMANVNNIVQKNGKWGIINQKGGWDVPAVYDSISYGTLHSLFKNGKMGLYGYYSPYNISIAPRFIDINYQYSLPQGFFVIRDSAGVKAVDLKLNPITEYFDSMALNTYILNGPAYKKGKKYYLDINKDGTVSAKEAAPEQETKRTTYEAPVFIKKENGKDGLYSNTEERWLAAPRYNYIQNDEGGYAAEITNSTTHKTDSTYLYNNEGKLLAALPGRHYIREVAKGLWNVGYYDTLLIVNDKGAIIVPGNYKTAETVEGNTKVLVVHNGAKSGIFNREGKMMTPPVLDGIGKSQDDHAVMGYLLGYIENDTAKNEEDETLYCLISPEGKMITQPLYTELIINPYHQDGEKPVFITKMKGKYGVIDHKGRILIPNVYDTVAQVYKHKIAIAKNKDGKWGMVNMKNKSIAPFIYNYLSVMNFDKAGFYRKEAHGTINVKGKEYTN